MNFIHGKQATAYRRIFEKLAEDGQHPRTGPSHPRCCVIDADPRDPSLAPIRVFVSPAGSWTHDPSRADVIA
jgi:hypothetical protein